MTDIGTASTTLEGKPAPCGIANTAAWLAKRSYTRSLADIRGAESYSATHYVQERRQDESIMTRQSMLYMPLLATEGADVAEALLHSKHDLPGPLPLQHRREQDQQETCHSCL